MKRAPTRSSCAARLVLIVTFIVAPGSQIGALDGKHVDEGQRRESDQPNPPRRHLFVGTQYYIPPGPPLEEWDRDMGRIKETGLELIKVVIIWGKVNPRPDQWEWGSYDRFFDLAEKHGLKVLVLLFPDAVPFWFQLKHPDNLFVDQDGRRIEFFASGEISMGGRPGPCFHNDAARRAGAEFLRRCAERYGKRSGLLGWNVWNEVAIADCYCPATLRSYQESLKRHYGSIEQLNTRWHRSYGSFDEIWLPKQGVYGDLFAHAEFLHAAKADFMRWRAEAVRSADSAHPISSHNWGIHLPRWSLDPWMVVEPLDAWGTSSNVGDTRDRLTVDDFYGMCLAYNQARDAAQGKPWWVAEMTGGRVREGLGMALRTEAELKTRVWAGFAFGAEAAVFWQWRPGQYGPYSGNYGLTDQAGERTSRTGAVKEITRTLSTHPEIMDRLEFPTPDVGLVWEPRGTLYEQFTPVRLPQQNLLGYRNFIGFYQTLLTQGYSVEILNARVLAERGIPTHLKVIFDPFQITDRKGLSQAYRQWVQAGGTLVAGPQYGRYDADMYVNSRVPPANIADFFGIKGSTAHFPKDLTVQPTATLFHTLANPSSLKGELLVEVYELAGAKLIGTWNSKPVITLNQFGQGRTIMTGSFLGSVAVSRTSDGTGHKLDAASNPGLAAWADDICRSSGAQPQAIADAGCFVRIANAPGGKVLFVFNPKDEEATTEVRVTKPPSGEIIDLAKPVSKPQTTTDRALRLSVAPQDSRILYWKN